VFLKYNVALKSATTNLSIVSILIILIRIPCASQTTDNSLIRVSENGRYFIDDSGKPFFWQGDTEWELFHLFTVSEARSLLLERKNQGFNVIQVMVTGVFPEWGQIKGMKPWDGMQAWLNNNPLTPDENYFMRVDSILAVAEEYGMMIVLGVYHARDSDAGRINSQNAQIWAKWIAQRYKNSKNVIWSMYPHAVPSSQPLVCAVVQGILEGDGGTHLITMHPDPSPTSSSFMHSELWLSFNTLQTWSTDLMNYDMVRTDYDRLPVKPVVNGEARYEDEDGTTPFETRRAGYWACLAGGFYSYGHENNWKSPLTWRNWYNSPGARHMVILGDLFRSIEWWKLLPDQSIFINQIEGNSAARSIDGDWILAYLTNTDPVTLNLDYLTGSNTVAGWWIDPTTGKRIKIGTFPVQVNHEFIAPEGWQDAVLFIGKDIPN
jgi:hypothetical protein